VELTPTEKAAILVEALPYIKKFHGKTIVIKYGGRAMVDDGLKQSVIRDISLLSLVGIRIVLVHGGGPQINELLEKLGIKPVFKNGLRVTDSETMKVVKMVLVGQINKDLVNLLNRQGINALGLSGEDGSLLKAERVADDLGFVGRVVEVKSEIITSLLNDGFIPVIATIGLGENGESLNINADEAASKIAIALKAEKLIILTDVDGVMEKGNLISRMSASEAEEMLSKKDILSGGMRPKLGACLEAVKAGVGSAHILNGTLLHALLLELFTDAGVGTMVVNS
jgi:acetylglutamate kinase